MKTVYADHPCFCNRHPQIITHLTPRCDCGGRVTPLRPQRPRLKLHRCPSPPKPQPGVVNVPQDTPPPNPKVLPAPPCTVGKPRPGDPSEIPRFRGKIGDMGRNSPTFGPRKDEYAPFPLIRTASGDCGNQAFSGVLGESRDIFVAPNTTPPMPPTQGCVAAANQPDTLSAHVWNMGKAPAKSVRVELYSFNPSLGITQADANLLGVDPSNRLQLQSNWTEAPTPYEKWMSRGSYAIVCCQPWFPTFENNGHERPVIRLFDPILDTAKPDQFSARKHRYVGHDYLAVVKGASPALIDLMLDLGYPDARADFEVELVLNALSSMEWLEIYGVKRSPGYNPPAGQVIAGLQPPTAMNARHCNRTIATGMSTSVAETKGAIPLRLRSTTRLILHQREAQVVRIRFKRSPDVKGGYSGVLIHA